MTLLHCRAPHQRFACPIDITLSVRLSTFLLKFQASDFILYTRKGEGQRKEDTYRFGVKDQSDKICLQFIN